jgi:hypothetical protein
MFRTIKDHVRRLLTASICCLCAVAFFLVPLPLAGAHNATPTKAMVKSYGYYDTYYSDASFTNIVGEYNSCTGVLTGQRTRYKYTEIIICG